MLNIRRAGGLIYGCNQPFAIGGINGQRMLCSTFENFRWEYSLGVRFRSQRKGDIIAPS